MIDHNTIIRHAKKLLGDNFEFRDGQFEVLVDILDTFFKGEKNLYLLDAPTGSGKSVIAILFSSLLNEYNMKGYILASDLSLFDQYLKDIERIDRFGYIKGIDNYTCAVNGEKFSLGDCKLQGVSYEDAEELPCFNECGYLVNRKKAIKSYTTLMTYPYWILQRNYVDGKMQEQNKSVPFPIRDFTICDEAHKVSEIVQNHFSPKINVDFVQKAEDFYAFLKKTGFPAPSRQPSRVKRIIQALLEEEDNGKLFIVLKDIELFLRDYARAAEPMKKEAASRFPSTKAIPRDWRAAFAQADFISDSHCKFEDYNHIISQVGVDFIVKNPQEGGAVFNCLEESYMMNRHFHEQAKFKLLMTATMGDPKDFMKTIGASKVKYMRMESKFDFNNSPIFFYPDKRMSMAKREANFDWMKDKVKELLRSHETDSGIIHSGSYEISSKLFNALDFQEQQRIILYSNSKEKDDALKRFNDIPNAVLMGPSILEGLDLMNEKSRFQIFLKVPYPSLGDKFVSAKLKYMPEWYNWKTCNAILQGVGRSIRSKDDWAITYFLDGCLSDLFRNSRNNFPPEFQKRIKIIR